MMSNNKDNKLIAEFMGSNLNGLEHWQYEEELQYHTSWDWLMPVVNKCYTSNMQHPNDDITQGLIDVDIEATYKAVVEFIKENERLNNEYVSYNEAPYGEQ